MFMRMNLQYFAENDTPEFTIDDFKSFAESNEDAQKFLQSEKQAFSDKSIESWKQNNLDKIKQTAIKEYEETKKNKTPEQIKIEELEAQFNQEKANRIKSDNKAYVAEQIASLKFEGETKDAVSEFMLNNLVTEDTDFTKNAVSAFTGVLAKMQENHREEIKNLQMDAAFGKKQQVGASQSRNTEPVENPEELLGQMLKEFN